MPPLEPDDVPPHYDMPDPVDPAHKAVFDKMHACARLVARRRRTAANPDEIANEVTVRLFTRWHKRPESVNEKGRPKLIERNVGKESRKVASRTTYRERKSFEAVEARGVLGAMEDGVPQLVGAGRADGPAMYDERVAVMHAAMADMDEDVRRYMHLKRIEQWTHAEIAAFHGVSEDAVDRALARANAVLIPIMQEYDDDGRVPPHVAARLREEET